MKVVLIFWAAAYNGSQVCSDWVTYGVEKNLYDTHYNKHYKNIFLSLYFALIYSKI